VTEIHDILGDIERLEPFPSAAIRILELSMGDAETEEIVAVVAEDPGLTAKILRLANSAQYAPVMPIESVLQATNRLGSRALASLVMTTGCASYYMGYGNSSARSNHSLWEECLHTALLARRLSTRMAYSNPELAYTVGLLQNVGHIVLDRFMNFERDEMVDLVERGRAMCSAEKELIGMDHAICGEKIARRWGLPTAFIQGIRYHHRPEEAGVFQGLCEVVQAAEAITSVALQDNGLSLLERGVAVSKVKHGLDGYELATMVNDVREDMYETNFAVS
jgi:HD-like signal output (HDOD) protein